MSQAATIEDTKIVTTTKVTCEGTEGSGGHPRVYIQLDAHTHEATCKYCSRTFKLDPNAKVSAGH